MSSGMRVETDLLSMLEKKSALRRKADLTRTLGPRGVTDSTIDLAGNDYLGLSNHPEVKAAAVKALQEYGLGATGSRLVRGSTVEHTTLEVKLAAFLGWPAALVYSSGYLANLGAIRAVTRANTVLIIDAHAHASLIDGCRITGAQAVIAPHANVGAVDELLAKHTGRSCVVITESVYSVDGDLAPLPELHLICRSHNALLLVDDAHALGVLGDNGGGGVAAAGLADEPDVIVTTTLSKAVGAAGGAVAARPEVIKHLIDTSRSFIYDTALPPAVVAGARAALTLITEGEQLRATVKRRALRAAEVLSSAGLSVSKPAAGVISVLAPSAQAAVAWARTCADQGVAVGCFRPPSTPDNRSRLRITINASISEQDFEKALDVILKTAKHISFE